MRTIYHRLILYILPCFAFFWLVCSLVVYWSVKQSSLKSLDAELVSLVRPIRIAFASEPVGVAFRKQIPNGPFSAALAGVGEKAGGIYYQLWNDQGVTLRKSPSLGDLELEFPGETGRQPSLTNQIIGNGEQVRVVITSGPGRPAGRGAPSARVTVMVAKSLDQVREVMRRWLLGLMVTSAAVIGLATILLRLSLKAGLRPLDNLTSNASEIDAGSLEVRFDPDQMPGELKPVARALNDLLSRLEASFERERRFSADLAHELRTPVATLKSLGQIALKWPEQASAEDYEDVCDISTRMSEIIESLLLLSRLEDGDAKPVYTPVDLNEMLDQQSRDLSGPISESGVNLDMESSGNLTIKTDRDLFGIIVSNLLRNAVAHAPPGSCIKIQFGHQDSIFRITNPAPDLKPDDVPHLFERFWKSDESRTGHHTSGLGLSIALSAAEAVGLELCAELDGDHQITFLVKDAQKFSRDVSLT